MATNFERNDEIIKEIGEMSLLQINDLVKKFQDVFGIAAVAPTMATASQDTEEDKPKTSSFYLKEIVASKIAVIKAIKEVLAIDLIPAKKIADAVAEKPQLIMENIDQAKIQELEAKFKEAGAIVEIK